MSKGEAIHHLLKGEVICPLLRERGGHLLKGEAVHLLLRAGGSHLLKGEASPLAGCSSFVNRRGLFVKRGGHLLLFVEMDEAETV